MLHSEAEHERSAHLVRYRPGIDTRDLCGQFVKIASQLSLIQLLRSMPRFLFLWQLDMPSLRLGNLSSV